jgi:hypothetical protein
MKMEENVSSCPDI